MRLPHTIAMLLLLPIFGQANSITDYQRQLFIDGQKDKAVAIKDATGIPVSIILGQAALESSWGTGTIAIEANNFFCIKCRRDWTGPTYRAWDDESEQSCFRKYESVQASFDDYAAFLKQMRYDTLKNYGTADYRSWAQGLQRAGYATDKKYAENLIRVIESNGLWVYDLAVSATGMKVLETEEMEDEGVWDDMDGEGFTPDPILEAPGIEFQGFYDQTQSPEESPTTGPETPKRKICPIVPVPNTDLERR